MPEKGGVRIIRVYELLEIIQYTYKFVQPTNYCKLTTVRRSLSDIFLLFPFAAKLSKLSLLGLRVCVCMHVCMRASGREKH